MEYIEASALISDCGLYRYTLTRVWNADRPTIIFCMLNPSTADGKQDDPTIKRCVALADSWGYGRLVVINLFAYRATNPLDLKRAIDPIGPDNDRHIQEQTHEKIVVCAWGASITSWTGVKWRERPFKVRRLMFAASQRHLGLAGNKQPKHPLYLPADSMLQAW